MKKIVVTLTLFFVTCNTSYSVENAEGRQATGIPSSMTAVITAVSEKRKEIRPDTTDVMDFVREGPRVGDFYKDKEGRTWKAISIFEGEGGQGRINAASYHPKYNRPGEKKYFFKLEREKTLVYRYQIPIVIALVLDESKS